jgi:hypothetical protein
MCCLHQRSPHLILTHCMVCGGVCRVQTGVMRFGPVGIAEAQLVIMASALTAGLCGPQVFVTPHTAYQITLSHFLQFGAAAVVVDTCINTLRHVKQHQTQHNINPTSSKSVTHRFA